MKIEEILSRIFTVIILLLTILLAGCTIQQEKLPKNKEPSYFWYVINSMNYQYKDELPGIWKVYWVQGGSFSDYKDNGDKELYKPNECDSIDIECQYVIKTEERMKSMARHADLILILKDGSKYDGLLERKPGIDGYFD